MDEFFETNVPDNMTSVEETLTKISQKLSNNPNDLNLLKQYSKKLLLTNTKFYYQMAFDSAEKILSIKPDDFESKIIIIKSLRYLKRQNDALCYAEQIQPEYPNDPTLLLELSSVLLDLNRNKEAEEILENLRTIFPKKIQFNLGILYMNYQQYESALGKFSEVLKDNPKNKNAIQNKCYVLYKLKRLEDAIDFIKNFLHEFPNDSDEIQHQLAGLCYQRAIDYEEKNPNVTNVSEIDGIINIETNLSEENQKLFQHALDEYLKLDERGAQNSVSTFYKARTLCNLHLYNDALVAIDESLQEPENWDALSRKSFILNHLGRYEDALKVSEIVLKDFPKDPTALSSKVNALWRLGRTKEYQHWFNIAKGIPQPSVNLERDAIERILLEKGSFEITGNKELDIQNVVSLFRRCKDHIFWIDPYFSSQGFEWILNANLESTSVKKILILTTDERASVEYYSRIFNNKFSNCKKILSENKIELSLKICIDEKQKQQLHARFIIAQNGAWQFTSVNNIQSGTNDTINPTITKSSKFDKAIFTSLDFENDLIQIREKYKKTKN